MYTVYYHTISAGYNIVIVESVGLGQSEVEIDRAVDMLLLLVPPGGGDGLQASKKGNKTALCSHSLIFVRSSA